MSRIRADFPRSAPADQIVATGVVVGLLYLGRGVLIPIALAVMLSFFIAPLVRKLNRLGLGQGASVCTAVVVLALGLLLAGMELGTQLVRMGHSLPQYETTIRGKIAQLNTMTLGRLDELTQRADSVISDMAPVHGSALPAASQTGESSATAAVQPIPVELHAPRHGPWQLLLNLFDTLASPLEMASVILIVLVFILLEQDTLGDRFLRLAGPGNLRATTAAVNDAAQRLSRYFVSQFGVNLIVGAVVWLALSLSGLPQAFLWGALTALLRFVPYIGVWIAALLATLLAAAIAPGWSQAILTLIVFLTIELLVSQLLEPHLYGHSTGLSPLSVVVSAIFWSALWGPAGLMLSTPLTLCLVVAGRYLPALSFLDILFGDFPSLNLPERFYQRVLRGDTHDILVGVRKFLKTQSIGAYCDQVLMPALYLALSDFEQRSITDDERRKVNHAVASLLIEFEGKKVRRRARISVLEDETLAWRLRQRREKQSGRWQGSLDVPAGSVVLVIAAEVELDELAAEVLVAALRAQRIDARRVSRQELLSPDVPSARVDILSLVWLISAAPEGGARALSAARRQLPADLPADKVMALALTPAYAKHEDMTLPDWPGSHVFNNFQGAIEYCAAAASPSVPSAEQGPG
ncbi:AI-2E family transporter [Paludibacterium yongneupense]|uniref:AI-2E family transporter n=1 Tax=Paludibacterium yongneupense TaxID=400061 RepID=UPI000686BC04|nr:AI-2E family transporter [Paludibacterium yongneupense]